MMALAFLPANLRSAPTDPTLTALMTSALQPGETVLLQTQTSVDEAIMVTTARTIIVKGPTRRSDPAHSGRYFPLDSITAVRTAGWFGVSFLAVITVDTVRESIPLFDRWRCTFGVTFTDKQLGNAVASYLRAVIAHIADQKRTALLNAPLQPIIPTVGIAIAAGEQFYLQTPAVYYAEHAYTDYTSGWQGFSFRVMRGVYYRIGGSRGRGVRRQSFEPDDHGQLLIGNRRVVFVGNVRNVALPMAQITTVKAFADGLQIGIANKSLIQFSTPDQMPGLLLKRVLRIP